MRANRRNSGRTVAKGRLRIIGGHWRSRVIDVPELPGLRPTADRARETLFNWLQADIYELSVLDLFAGTGILAFEALSRGAASAVLVERNPQAIKAMQNSATQLDAQAEIICGDALAYLNSQRATPRFDLVFLDPPFAQDLWLPVLQALPPCLNPGHRVYVEVPKSRNWSWPAGWQELKQKSAGDVSFFLLEYSPEDHK